MRCGDSRSRAGVFYPLQHEHFDAPQSGSPGPWELHTRSCLVAYRITGRLQGAGEVGHWVYDPDSVGDILGGQLWEAETRDIPLWRFATPVVADTPIPLIGGGTEQEEGICPILTAPDMVIRPIYDKTYAPDMRVKTLPLNLPTFDGAQLWPKFPLGGIGISLTANREQEQEDLYFPVDPNLYAVNRAGDPDIGTRVYDLKPFHRADENRWARLQSFWRVIKWPETIDLPAPPPDTGTTPPCWEFPEDLSALAWSLMPSWCDNVGWGLVVDQPPLGQGVAHGPGLGVGPGTVGGPRSLAAQSPFVIGMTSKFEHGPFDVGNVNEMHTLGKDADNNPINSLHITTNALYRMDDTHDAPLQFDPAAWEDPFDAPYLVPVFLRVDPNEPHGWICGTARPGMWKWVSKCVLYTQATSSDTGAGAGSAPATGPDAPPAPTQIGYPRKQPIATTPMQSAWSVLLGRPQHMNASWPDLRVSRAPTSRQLARLDDRTPIVARLEAFGRQQGAEWTYTTDPCRSRFRGGTARGGFVLLPPEIDMADEGTSFAPAGITRSRSVLATLSGATYFAAGLPDTDTGDILSGYRWTTDTDGDLIYERLDSAGAATSAFEMSALGNLGIGGNSYGSGEQVVFIANAGRTPTANPTGGGILYVTGGALTYRGSSGTITTIAPA